jgi:phosphoribosyl-ATP pyrophosphohydrolase
MPQNQPITLEKLYEIVCERKTNAPPDSYTNYLFKKGEDEILKKIGEESIEVILASKSQGNQRLIEEVADLYYHLQVLLASREITPEDIYIELSRRHQLK